MSKNPNAVKLGRRGGKVGGKATSPAKKKSGKANMAKARESRWPQLNPEVSPENETALLSKKTKEN